MGCQRFGAESGFFAALRMTRCTLLLRGKSEMRGFFRFAQNDNERRFLVALGTSLRSGAKVEVLWLCLGMTTERRLVGGGVVGVVDHEGGDGAVGGGEFEAELLLDGLEERQGGSGFVGRVYVAAEL